MLRVSSAHVTGKSAPKLDATMHFMVLRDIDGDSEQEFADWIEGMHPTKSSGGHPWEIKRGGNTTQINLGVYGPYSFDKQ
jgi:hypothetical protein